MISLILLLLTIVLSRICVRIGAIALELTGMPSAQADFQALSAFSGVGFTTREAEFAISHPQRRKIISALIKLGSAGVITTLVTVGGTVLSGKSILETFSRDPKYSWLPVNIPILVLIGVTVLSVLVLKALRKPSISRFAKELVSAALLKSKIVKPLSFHEVLVNGDGYGVFQIEISDRNPLAGRRVGDLKFAEKEIKLLYVNRMSESLNPPPPDLTLSSGDIIAVYGPVMAVHDTCVDLREEKENTGVEDEGPLSEGSPAPEFSLPDQNGNKVSLSDYKNRKNLVMVFYPKDKSFFCSTQLKTLSDHLPDIGKMDAEVVAVNQESMKSHAGFCDSSGLRFPLLSDASKEVCSAYKALMFGGLLVDRTVYIIDKRGVIRYAKRGKPAFTEILAALRSAQGANISI